MTVYIFNRRELLVPWIVAAGLVALAVWRKEWLALVGLPLVGLSWRWCAPSLNLFNGCVPLLASGMTLGIAVVLESRGLTMAAIASFATLILASMETEWRSRTEEW